MSINDPHLFVPRLKVLGLYNQEHATLRVRMTPDVETWFDNTARSLKWVDVRFSSEGCTLTCSLIHERERIQRESGKVVSLDQQGRRFGK
jgi:hypothetical protein